MSTQYSFSTASAEKVLVPCHYLSVNQYVIDKIRCNQCPRLKEQPHHILVTSALG